MISTLKGHTIPSPKESLAEAQTVLTKPEYIQIQEFSSRLKGIREPIRELVRSSIIAKPERVSTECSDYHSRISQMNKLLDRVREQLDSTESTIHACLVSLSYVAKQRSLKPSTQSKSSSNTPKLPSEGGSPVSHVTASKDSPHPTLALPTATHNIASPASSKGYEQQERFRQQKHLMASGSSAAASPGARSASIASPVIDNAQKLPSTASLSSSKAAGISASSAPSSSSSSSSTMRKSPHIQPRQSKPTSRPAHIQTPTPLDMSTLAEATDTRSVVPDISSTASSSYTSPTSVPIYKKVSTASTLQPSLTAYPSAQSSTVSRAIEKAIQGIWNTQTIRCASTVPVSDAYSKLDKRHIACIEERIPQIPIRAFGNEHRDHSNLVIDAINSLMHTNMQDGSPSVLTKTLDSIPPGIVACAIASSTSQLFQRLSVDDIVLQAYKGTRAQVLGRQLGGREASKGIIETAAAISKSASATRTLSDHANFLTRFAECTILYPTHASQRARRIEWWVLVVCLLRELGDYESLSSLVCIFSSATMRRLGDTWDLVPQRSKDAIQFILDHVLKIHPNYSSYRDEFQARMDVLSKSNGAAESSLDCPNSPESDEYVHSPVYCRESAKLPRARVLIPIVAVLAKDAISSPSGHMVQGSDAGGEPKWIAMLESPGVQRLPLQLDTAFVRRTFTAETNPQLSENSGVLSTPRAFGFLRRTSRRPSTERTARTQCRIMHDDGTSTHAVPTIVDMLRHLIALAAGNPCYTCALGASLDMLHISTSAKLAVTVASLVMFAEPWIPHEYALLLCNAREPRTAPSPQVRSPSQPFMKSTKLPTSGSVLLRRPKTQESVTQPSEFPTGERRGSEGNWIMAFKVGEPEKRLTSVKPEKYPSKHESPRSSTETQCGDQTPETVYHKRSQSTPDPLANCCELYIPSFVTQPLPPPPKRFENPPPLPPLPMPKFQPTGRSIESSRTMVSKDVGGISAEAKMLLDFGNHRPKETLNTR